MRRQLLTILLASILILPAHASDVEKKGYIINNNGDTIYGKILLRKELGAISNIQLFTQVRFADSTGTLNTYKPGTIKGYGIALVNDTILSHFISFNNVEMQATFGSKKENAFMLRELRGFVDVYHLLHSITNGYQRYEIPEIYLLTGDEPRTLVRIKPKALKVPTRYRRSDILPYLKDWPEAEYSKVHDELSPMELMVAVATYNEWRKTNIINNQ
ncbi:MAG TPA: hypothetical protein VK166_03870 [Chitinophagaceae bacterium]|nr:hypothetical protein [Chitinophagaceae bacterium]